MGYFLYRGAPTQNIPVSFAPARSLCEKGLLEGTPGSGNMFQWPYTIPAYVWDELGMRTEELYPKSELDARLKFYDQ